MRHFLDLKDFSTDDLQAMLDDGLHMKAAQKSGEEPCDAIGRQNRCDDF